MNTEHFRFAPDILRRLGEELIPHPEQGIIELVRNAYDADAFICEVELRSTDTPGGTIIIKDDGAGMTDKDIGDGWLVLGKSRKSLRRPTKLQRLPVGDKGLGRLAALRLGKKALLTTRPAARPGVEYRLELDWEKFDKAKVVEDVQIQITEHKTTQNPGTLVEIVELETILGAKEVQRLARALVLLADPFADKSGFRPKLIAPGLARFEKSVQHSYLQYADFHLAAELKQNGDISASIADWRGVILWRTGNLQHNSTQDRIWPHKTHYKAPETRFELWTFLLSPQSFHRRSIGLDDLREWLQSVGGVHFYHRGLRVYPYGDPGHDWLDMNLSRVRSPEERPSTNNSVGRLIVLDPKEELIQKTDRTGFIENESFEEIRRFAKDALDWMADVRLKAREARKQTVRVKAAGQVRKAHEKLELAIQTLPEESRTPVKAAVEAVEKAKDREIRNLREEIELYRTLGTVGTTIAVFAHESGKPISQISGMMMSIEKRAKRELGERYQALLEKPVSLILRAINVLKTYSTAPLRLLDQSKRRAGLVDIHKVFYDCAELFQPFLEANHVEIRSEFVDRSVLIRGTVSGLEAIITNLITNAVTALTDTNSPINQKRIIAVKTEVTRKRVVIRVLDSGPGIKEIAVEDIWLPGKTTTSGGTGLGLSIVRDAAIDLGGRVSAIPSGELGGAEFIIDLPLLEATQ